jgi:hypothetical protein
MTDIDRAVDAFAAEMKNEKAVMAGINLMQFGPVSTKVLEAAAKLCEESAGALRLAVQQHAESDLLAAIAARVGALALSTHAAIRQMQLEARHD